MLPFFIILLGSQVIKGLMWPDIVPDILPFLELFSHCIEVKRDIALLIELSLIRPMRYLHIGIFLGAAGMGEIV